MTDEEIDALVTRRLIVFHQALVRRGQIMPASENFPSSLIVAGGVEVTPDIRFFIESDRSCARR